MLPGLTSPPFPCMVLPPTNAILYPSRKVFFFFKCYHRDFHSTCFTLDTHCRSIHKSICLHRQCDFRAIDNSNRTNLEKNEVEISATFVKTCKTLRALVCYFNVHVYIPCLSPSSYELVWY